MPPYTSRCLAATPMIANVGEPPRSTGAVIFVNEAMVESEKDAPTNVVLSQPNEVREIGSFSVSQGFAALIASEVGLICTESRTPVIVQFKEIEVSHDCPY